VAGNGKALELAERYKHLQICFTHSQPLTNNYGERERERERERDRERDKERERDKNINIRCF
jgi:hypothetical protein